MKNDNENIGVDDLHARVTEITNRHVDRVSALCEQTKDEMRTLCTAFQRELEELHACKQPLAVCSAVAEALSIPSEAEPGAGGLLMSSQSLTPESVTSTPLTTPSPSPNLLRVIDCQSDITRVTAGFYAYEVTSLSVRHIEFANGTVLTGEDADKAWKIVKPGIVERRSFAMRFDDELRDIRSWKNYEAGATAFPRLLATDPDHQKNPLLCLTRDACTKQEEKRIARTIGQPISELTLADNATRTRLMERAPAIDETPEKVLRGKGLSAGIGWTLWLFGEASQKKGKKTSIGPSELVIASASDIARISAEYNKCENKKGTGEACFTTDMIPKSTWERDGAVITKVVVDLTETGAKEKSVGELVWTRTSK